MIPKGWAKSTLGDHFEKRTERGDSSLPLKSVTMHEGLIDRSDNERRTESNLDPEQHLLARKGDIVYNMMRMWQGASGLATSDCMVSPAYVVCKPKKTLDAVFASYLFKFPPTIKALKLHSQGAYADRLRLYFNDFARIQVLIPPQSEQMRIAEIFSCWDRGIEENASLINQCERRRDHQLKTLFSRIETEFPTSSIGTLCEITSGGTPSRLKPEFFGGSIPWLKSGEVRQGQIFAAEESISELGLASSSAKVIPANTTVVAMYGATAGQVGILRKPMAINQAVAAITPIDKHLLDSTYVYLSMQFKTPSLLRKVQGSGQPNLSGGLIKEVKIAVPSMREQNQISNYILELNKELQLLQAAGELLSKQKQGLMQKLLTGKIRVKGAA